MTRLRNAVFLGFLTSVIILSGCAEGTGNKQKITGSVTFKDKPLDKGAITFFPEKGPPAAGADIVNGKYSVPIKEGLAPGTYRVTISATSGQADFPAGELPGEAPIRKEMIPAKYNAESKLTAEVKAGENVIDFKLD